MKGDLSAEAFNVDLAASMREDLGRNFRERGGLHEELECMHVDVIPLEDCKCEDILAAEPLAKTTVKAARKSDFRRRNEINFRNLSRENQILMYDAMRQELGSQDVLGAIRKLKHQEIRADRLMPSRWVLSDKNAELSATSGKLALFLAKARLVAGGHRDPDIGLESAPRTDAPTADLLGIHLIMSLAASRKWALSCSDVKTAFLRGKDQPRELYVRLPSEMPPDCGYEPHEIVEVVKGLYGLSEAPRLWWLEYKAALEELGFIHMKLLPGVFALFRDGIVRAVVGLHVDDAIMVQAEGVTVLEQLRDRFEYGTWKKHSFKFCGRQVEQDPETFEVTVDMDEYCSNITLIDLDRQRRRQIKERITPQETSVLRGKLGEVQWLARELRADLSFECSRLQQLVEVAAVQELLETNKLLNRARESGFRLVFRELDYENLAVCAISDSSHGNMRGGGSQAGWLVALADNHVMNGEAKASVVSWASHRIKRVVRSTLAAEAMGLSTAVEHADFVRAAMSELCDATFVLRDWLQGIKRWLQIWVVDAKSVYDSLRKESSLPSDRRLAIDVACLRDTLAGDRNDVVKWIPGPQNPADALTKGTGNDTLRRLMHTGTFSLKEEKAVAEARGVEAEKRRQRRNMKKAHDAPG